WRVSAPDGRADTKPATDDSASSHQLILISADDPGVVADHQREPGHVGDRILDEADSAVAQADVDASPVQAASLSAAVVQPVSLALVIRCARIARHAKGGHVGHAQVGGEASLQLVAAVVA